jgi:hypothetical protein
MFGVAPLALLNRKIIGSIAKNTVRTVFMRLAGLLAMLLFLQERNAVSEFL